MARRAVQSRFSQETFTNYLILRARGASSATASAHCGRRMGGPTPLPPQMPTTLRSLFSNYTSVPTPNGKSIHIIAQRGVSPERLMRERLKLTLLVMRGEGIDPDALSDAGAILLLYAGEERPQSHWARVIRPEGGRSARVGAL